MPTLPPPQPTTAISLQDAESFALKNSPLLGIAASQTLEAGAALETARGQGLFRPFAFGTAQYLYATGNNSATAYLGWPDMARVGTNNPAPPGSTVPPSDWSKAYNNGVLALSTQLLLFDFGAAEARIRAAEHAQTGARDREQAVRVEVLADVDSAYLAVLAAHEAVAAAQAAVARALSDERYAEAGLAAGLRAEIDVDRARDQVAMAQLAVSRAVGQVEATQEGLAMVMGAPPSPLPDASEIGSASLPGGTDASLIQQALATRPDVLAIQEDIATAAEVVRSLRDLRWPALAGTGGVSDRGQDLSHTYGNWDVGVVLSWPIYDPTLSGRIDEALAREKEIEATRQDLAAQVENQVVLAVTHLRTGTALVVAAREHEAAANATLAQAQGRYSHGFGTWPELTDAEANKIDADLALIQAQYQEQQAGIELRRALGLPAAELP